MNPQPEWPLPHDAIPSGEGRGKRLWPARPLRIAVADDEPDMREYLERILPRLGHQVVASARTGVELLSAYHREHPDLIITDIRMPELSGDVAVQQIRQTQMVPVILISAYARGASENETTLELCSRLRKPVGRSELEAAIKSLADEVADGLMPTALDGEEADHD
jgi:CheY-like chemotaxis protein